MKKLNLIRLSFCTMMMLAATAFTGCVDDNTDDGMPYLEVTPSALTFDANANPATTDQIVVKTNRAWELSIEDGGEWVKVEPQKGTGNATISVIVPPSNLGRSTTLTISLKNTYGAYMSEAVTVEQGTIGDVTRLVSYIKSTWPTGTSNAYVNLNYSQTEIEGVILANNAGGNNGNKLYVGDNVNAGNSAIILYNSAFNTAENYPVGRRVKLDLSQAQYNSYYSLRELSDVTVTLLEGTEEVVVPELTVAQFNTGNYQGQYVKVLDVTTLAANVGNDWAGSANQTLMFSAGADETLAVRMSTATYATGFANLKIAQYTGSISGTAEQNNTSMQLMPVTSDDITGFFEATPTVTTGDATDVTLTGATLPGSMVYVTGATETGIQYIAAATGAAIDWATATKKTATATDNSWSVALTDLTTGQQYAFRAYAVTPTATYTGEAKYFTPDVPATVTVDFSDLTTYPTGFPAGSSEKKVDATVYKFSNYDFTLAGSSGGGFYQGQFSTAYYLMLGQQGAYMQLPAIADKSLTKVRCTVPSGASASVQVGIFDAAGKAVSGGEAITWTKDGFADQQQRTYVYNVTGTDVNTAYRIQVASAHNSQFAKLELWYMDGAAASISVDPKTLSFAAAADATGQQVTVTVKNAEGLNVYVSNTNATNFPATYADGKLTVTSTTNASETESRSATITTYLAATADGTHVAEAAVTVTQASSKPKTIAELRTQMKGMNPTSAGVAFPSEWVGLNVVGYIAANNASGNLNRMVAVIDNDNAVGSGILLYSADYNTEPDTSFPVGSKITIRIAEGTKAALYNNLLELTGAETTVSTTETAPIKVAEITASDLLTKDYQGMYVKVSGLKRAANAYEQWGPSSTGYVDFLGGTSAVTVGTYNTCAWAKDWVSPTVTGAVSGIAEQYNTEYRIFPQVAADVAAFKENGPAIVTYAPTAIEFDAAGGTSTVTLSVLGSAAVTVSGLSTPFTSQVAADNQSVTVTAPANAGAAIAAQNMVLSVAGGNSVTVAVSQRAAGTSAPKYIRVTTAPADWSGTYVLASVYNSKAMVLNGKQGSSLAEPTDATSSYNAATDSFTANTTLDAMAVTVAAVTGTSNYSLFMKNGDLYIGYGSSTSLAFGDAVSSDKYQWALSTDAITNANATTRWVGYNYNNGSDRFGAYTSTSASILKAVLYKRSE